MGQDLAGMAVERHGISTVHARHDMGLALGAGRQADQHGPVACHERLVRTGSGAEIAGREPMLGHDRDRDSGVDRGRCRVLGRRRNQVISRSARRCRPLTPLVR